MMKNIFAFLILSWLAVLTGCSSCKSNSAPTQQIHIAAVNGPNAPSSTTGLIRYKALSETATLVGAQGGLAFRSEQINCVLKKQQTLLDQVYNFRALLLKDDIKPPVLEEGRDELTLDSCDAIRAADQIYRIVAPPCFVTAPPNWRDFIWMKFCRPESPDITLLPRNTEEAGIWNCYVQIGWQQGMDQANQIFGENLSRLKRDYNGMLLYRKLLAQNMVTPPYVAKTELGVTGDGNELRINDRVLRISATSQLNTNPCTWKPVVSNPGQDTVFEGPPMFQDQPLQKCTKITRKKISNKPKRCMKNN
jgi:defect-in-organelle-trafficking protein DotC